ncbi:MAG: NADPH-dependent assimilatory sulfite reductase hemoprotein subunit [Caldilineaceae bacterium]|nr:NADPH-dependent assimilatory sulfite reductase hemoprotein subunit [Caldilineaceae bacterium]
MTRSLSKLETIKAASSNLRGDLAAEVDDTGTTHFDEAGKQLLKFHGLYQQDDRDARKDNRANGRDKAYSFMLRTRIPGGQLTADQYLVHDELADRFANHTLRITTRQCFQLHGVLKGDIKASIQALDQALITSLGACGDLVRNVMCCPAPVHDPIRAEIEQVTRAISDHLLPRTRAYHEIWLEGEKVVSGREQAEEEPIYGKTYLPRKFKIAVAYPGDNCVDVFTQDIGLIAVAEDGRLAGFNVVVGGGMGMSHTKPDTFPRLADLLGFVPPEQVLPVVETIVLVQRDYGNRSDRKHARMKYLLHEWGVDRFRRVVESRLGWMLAPARPLPPLVNDLHLGWHEQGDGRWFLGVSVENGRIKDEGDLRLKTGLRTVIQQFRPNVRLTPNHDILLTDVAPEARAAIDAVLAAHGVLPADALTQVRRHAMACVALPTCGLALAEAERALPAVIDRLEVVLAELGLARDTISVRMTGCPNGCARPYVADIAFVGRSADRYAVFVGGRSDGTRLNRQVLDLVPGGALVDALQPLLAHYAATRNPGEGFGDFCDRMAPADLAALLEAGQSAHEEVQHVTVLA